MIASLAMLIGIGANLARPAQTAAATNNVINFQARLEGSTGAIVADGTYNVEFKLYNASSSSGSSQGSCTGDANCLWTEDYLVSAVHGIQVVNGYLTANLGSLTGFPSTINWDQQLYLTMRVGATGSSPTWDTEMSPRLQVTSVPYAFRAGRAGGLFDPAGSGATLSWNSPGSAFNLLLPNETGTLCSTASTDTCGGNFIQNQNTGVQLGANFDIDGSGTLGGALNVSGVGTFSRNGATGGNDYTLGVTGTPIANATSSLIRIGAAIGSGNATAGTGGTYIGINEPSSGAGSTADFVNFQNNGTSEFKITSTGNITGVGSLTINNVSAGATGATVSYKAVKPAANMVLQNFLLSTDTAASFAVQGSGQLNWGPGGSTATDTDLYRSGINALQTDGAFTAAGNIQGVVLNATTGFQVNGAAATGNYLRGNGTNFVGSSLLASDLSGTLFTLQGSTGVNQNVASGSTVSILAGSSANLTSVASATNTITVDIVNNPNFSGLVTASKTGATALAVTGAPTNTATSSLIQIGNAISGGNTSANGGTYIGLNAPGSGNPGNAADFINFQVNGSSKFKVDTFGDISAGSTITITSNSLTSGSYNKTFTAGTGGVSINDVVILANDGGNARILDTATKEDTRVIGIANATTTSGSSVSVKLAGNAQVTADTGAVAIGDQLVTSTTSGQVTVDNSATSGILGYATSTKAGGSSGLVSVTIHPVNGVTNPVFGGNVTVQGTGSFTGAGTALSVTNNATIGGTLGVTGVSTLTAQLNANGGIVTNNTNVNAGTGTITSGAINGQTINATANFTGTVAIQGANALTLGTGSTVGSLTFNADSTHTVTLNATTFTSGSSYSLTLPTAIPASSGLCLQSGATVGSTNQLAFNSCGGGTTLQGAYNGSAAAAPSILTTSALNPVTIQTANASGIAAGSELFGVHLNHASDTIGNSLFTVNSNGVGINVGTTAPTTGSNIDLAFGQGANRTISVLTQGTTNTAGNNLTVSAATGNGTGGGGTLNLQGGAASATAGSAGGGIAITATNGTGTTTGAAGGSVTITAGNAGGSGVNAGGTITLQAGSATTTGANGGVLVKGAANSSTAFQIQNTSSVVLLTADTSNTINRIGISPAGNFDFVNHPYAATSTLEVGGQITASGPSASGSNGGGAFFARGFSATGAGVAAFVGNWNNTALWGLGQATSSSSDNTVRLGNVDGGSTPGTAGVWSATQNLNLALGGSITIGTNQTYTGTGALNVTSGGATALGIDTGGGAAINIGAANATSIVLGGNASGTITDQVSATSTAGYTLQTTTNVALLTGDAHDNELIVGATGGTPILLVLANKNTSGDPTEVDGAMYYNGNTGNFRCGVDTIWVNCGSLLSSNTSPSSAVSNCTSGCAAMSIHPTIPANYCTPGRVIQITAAGVYSDTSTPSLDFGVYLGSNATTRSSDTLLGSVSNTPVAGNGVTDDGWNLTFSIICDTAGAPGTVNGQGFYNLKKSGTTTNSALLSSATTSLIDTTTSNTIYLFPTWSAASTSNTVTLEQFIVTAP